MVKVKDIKEILICPVCKDVMNEPLTLMCNHTFCYICLAGTEENMWELSRDCPICKKKYCLPPTNVVNFTLRDVIQTLIGKKRYEKTKKSREAQLVKHSLRNKVIKELRDEYHASVVDNVDFRDIAEEIFENEHSPVAVDTSRETQEQSNISKYGPTFILGSALGGTVVGFALYSLRFLRST